MTLGPRRITGDTSKGMLLWACTFAAGELMADRSWPPGLRYSESMFQIVGQTTLDAASRIEGQEPIVVSPSGRWKAAVTIPITDRRYWPPRAPRRRLRAFIGGFRLNGGRALQRSWCRIATGRGPAHRARIIPQWR